MKKDTSDILISVGLDQDSVPDKITWSAEQNGSKSTECKAFLLSLFEKDSKETLKIDLWTKDLQVQEMDRFFYHTLNGMTQTYSRSTNNQELAVAMKDFTEYFGKKIGFLAE